MLYEIQIRYAKRFFTAAIGTATAAAAASAASAAAATGASAATAAAMSATAVSAATASATAAAAASTGLMLGMTGIMGGMSYMQASQAQSAQNSYMKDSYAAQNKAIAVEQRQIVDQQSLEKKKAISQSQLIQSRIRVTAGESGLGLSGNYEHLIQQADYDTALNLGIIDQNASNKLQGAASQMQPINSQQFNPLISGILGGMGGFQTGLSITDSMARIKRAS